MFLKTVKEILEQYAKDNWGRVKEVVLSTAVKFLS